MPRKRHRPTGLTWTVIGAGTFVSGEPYSLFARLEAQAWEQIVKGLTGTPAAPAQGQSL